MKTIDPDFDYIIIKNDTELHKQLHILFCMKLLFDDSYQIIYDLYINFNKNVLFKTFEESMACDFLPYTLNSSINCYQLDEMTNVNISKFLKHDKPLENLNKIDLYKLCFMPIKSYTHSPAKFMGDANIFNIKLQNDIILEIWNQSIPVTPQKLSNLNDLFVSYGTIYQITDMGNRIVNGNYN